MVCFSDLNSLSSLSIVGLRSLHPTLVQEVTYRSSRQSRKLSILRLRGQFPKPSSDDFVSPIRVPSCFANDSTRPDRETAISELYGGVPKLKCNVAIVEAPLFEMVTENLELSLKEETVDSQDLIQAATAKDLDPDTKADLKELTESHLAEAKKLISDGPRETCHTEDYNKDLASRYIGSAYIAMDSMQSKMCSPLTSQIARGTLWGQGSQAEKEAIAALDIGKWKTLKLLYTKVLMEKNWPSPERFSQIFRQRAVVMRLRQKAMEYELTDDMKDVPNRDDEFWSAFLGAKKVYLDLLQSPAIIGLFEIGQFPYVDIPNGCADKDCVGKMTLGQQRGYQRILPVGWGSDRNAECNTSNY